GLLAAHPGQSTQAHTSLRLDGCDRDRSRGQSVPGRGARPGGGAGCVRMSDESYRGRDYQHPPPPAAGVRGLKPDSRPNRVEMHHENQSTARHRPMSLFSTAAHWAAALLITALISGVWFLLAAVGFTWQQSRARAKKQKAALDAYAEHE